MGMLLWVELRFGLNFQAWWDKASVAQLYFVSDSVFSRFYLWLIPFWLGYPCLGILLKSTWLVSCCPFMFTSHLCSDALCVQLTDWLWEHCCFLFLNLRRRPYNLRVQIYYIGSLYIYLLWPSHQVLYIFISFDLHTSLEGHHLPFTDLETRSQKLRHQLKFTKLDWYRKCSNSGLTSNSEACLLLFLRSKYYVGQVAQILMSPAEEIGPKKKWFSQRTLQSSIPSCLSILIHVSSYNSDHIYWILTILRTLSNTKTQRL